ncbi:MAG: SDR family NAD(P)-dependent oxidoreductase [Cellvibrionaceae bacterium]
MKKIDEARSMLEEGISGRQEVIWITGASSGIGRGLAIKMASQGHQVIASARSSDDLYQLSIENKNIATHVVDVCDVENLNSVSALIEKQYGYIDKIIINAGSCEYFDVDEPDWGMMRRVMEVNYFGSINTVQQALPLLRKSLGSTKKSSANSKEEENCYPHIVVVASLASVVPFPRAEAYGASKAALQYFFESLRIDLDKENIGVTIIQPGFVKTPLTDKNDFPMPFIITADEAVDTIVKKMGKQNRLFYFPKRLGLLIYLMRTFSSFWHWLAVNKLSRQSSTSNNH